MVTINNTDAFLTAINKKGSDGTLSLNKGTLVKILPTGTVDVFGKTNFIHTIEWIENGTTKTMRFLEYNQGGCPRIYPMSLFSNPPALGDGESLIVKNGAIYSRHPFSVYHAQIANHWIDTIVKHLEENNGHK